MGGSQMAKPDKKREPLEITLGRPKKGALSTYPKALVDLIYKLRDKHEGWGAITILVELEEEYGYEKSQLPSIDGVNRYLQEQGFIKEREPSRPIPSKQCKGFGKYLHGLWEMDAQGSIRVKGLGLVSMINIKDQKSKLHCMAFPVPVKGKMSQPKTASYYWALRFAFEEWGLPRAIQVDKDSVFIDNTSKSPFPSQTHLFLIGLGIELCFTDVPPPKKQSTVERSHQTMDRQTTAGQEYRCWQQLFRFCIKRKKRINENIPNRMLGKQPPLVAFPKAIHSGRRYCLGNEEQLIDMKRIQRYLAKCAWYRKVSKDKTISLNATIYYLKHAKKESQVQIAFCNRRKKLVFRDAKELVIATLPIKNLSVDAIMGATTKQLISMKKKLLKAREFPL